MSQIHQLFDEELTVSEHGRFSANGGSAWMRHPGAQFGVTEMPVRRR